MVVVLLARDQAVRKNRMIRANQVRKLVTMRMKRWQNWKIEGPRY